MSDTNERKKFLVNMFYKYYLLLAIILVLVLIIKKIESIFN